MVSSLEAYLDELHEQPLVCCPEPEIRKAIVSFNSAYKKLFSHSTYLTKGIMFNESI